MSNKKKRNFVVILIILILLGISFIVYNRIANADTNSNKIAIDFVKMTGIDTGTSTFDSSDGLDYSDSSSYSLSTGYTAGNDSNASNRIVRSFDTITYHFSYAIEGKTLGTDYEDRQVSIKVTIPDEIKDYVSFTKNSLAGETTYTYTFDGIDSYSNFKSDITLYVLGAPNGTEINPKFEIYESTNTDSSYVINLGNISENSYYYEYDSNKSTVYSTVSNTSGFNNYMPTIVSSKTGNIKFTLIPQTTEGQSATYNSVTGRYLTYVFGVKLVGDTTKGVKGLTMPDSDINFTVSLSQNGNISTVSLEDSWTRLYKNETISSISPVVVALPYSNSSDTMIKYPGNITLTNSSTGIYTGVISDYGITYSKASVNADNTKISSSDYYIGTYALTVFSGRNSSDGKNDITTNMAISNIGVTDTAGASMNVSSVSASLVNKYYETVDYSLTGEFYSSGSKLSTDTNGKGAVSKGTTVTYKTTFNYEKTLSDQGLKEIIKIDPDAYRVIAGSDGDIQITVNSSGSLSKDDFEIKYVSGSYENTNYSATNNSTVDSRINSEDASTVLSACSTVASNLSTYTKDQIMNLYGGPCITANSGVETEYSSISDASVDGVEVPITKIIVQTKDGVVLPDSTTVTIEVTLRVRNVSDLTKTYQVTAVATSSDYDNNITYYSPRVTTDENSITNPNNYNKTTYSGTNVSTIDTDSVWGDCLKIVNFTSRQEITVTNQNSDGSIKTAYSTANTETLNYNIKTTITDNNEIVGADDTWYITNLKVYVYLPSGLNYVGDDSLGTPEVIALDTGQTLLIYTLPYTKPNMSISDINFNATISPTIKGSAVPLTVTSSVYAINVNGETDTSYFGLLTGEFTIYVTGVENVIVSQTVGDSGSRVEKDEEFSYKLSLYNNTSSNITDYSIVDILPSSGDTNGSDFNGSYQVKIDLPSSLAGATIYCSQVSYSALTNDISNENNKFEECDAANEYVTATAIKIENISIDSATYADEIVLHVKPTGNEYSDKYINSFIGGSQTYSQTSSNKIEVRVISRNISGRVFVDVDADGIEDESDKYLADIPITLYKLDSENNMTEVDSTITNSSGEYEFKDLDVGRYKIRASYDNDKYDLTLRYATEDTAKDSDAYKISDGIVEISNKKTSDTDSEGIKVTRDIESVTDMNVGLLTRVSLGFDISKYITKVELSYNNTLTTYDYDNQSKVSLSIKNSLKATAKIYYGIRVENNSYSSGYIKTILETLPSGLTFDSSDSYNEGWFYSDGELMNISLENDLLEPGDVRYLKIALDMPTQLEAKTFINTVTILDIEAYEPEEEAEDAEYDPNLYEVGESVNYAGINWHIINASEKVDGAQELTLLADSGSISTTMGHTSSKDTVYKWSTSLISSYLNNTLANETSLNLSILSDNYICDDASGLSNGSYGGTLQSAGTCISAVYYNYKVRLLTESEYNSLKNSDLEDLSWLYGNSDYWLMNSVYVEHVYDEYGNLSALTNVSNLAKYVSKSNSTVQTGYNSSSTSSWVYSNTKKEVRPVITISSSNVIAN